MQLAYNFIKKRYPETKIIVPGYSIGTGAAAYVTSTNHPQLLILQGPYNSLKDMMRPNYPIIPIFIVKYKFETNKYLENSKKSIVIFHGDADEVIYNPSSVKLRTLLKGIDILITLHVEGHNGITDNPDYQNSLHKILK